MSADEAPDTTAPESDQAQAAGAKPEPAPTPKAPEAAPAPRAPAADAGPRSTPESDSYAGDGDRRRPRRRSESSGDAVLCRPLEVIVKDDRVDQAIRQLKNRLAREGVLRELKNRRHYFKPSELKRIKRREAARRRRKQARQRARK